MSKYEEALSLLQGVDAAIGDAIILSLHTDRIKMHKHKSLLYEYRGKLNKFLSEANPPVNDKEN